jgi:signal transduction histidine kinase
MKSVESAKSSADPTGPALRLLQESLEHRIQTQAAELKTLRTQFQASGHTLVHDIRGPLTSIAGFAELLLENSGAKLDAKGLLYLQTVISSAAKLNDILVKTTARPPG